MPRYRTISCHHCGFMQLKRDTECERCGRLTKRGRRQLVLWSVNLAVVLTVGFVFYSQVKGLAG